MTRRHPSAPPGVRATLGDERGIALVLTLLITASFAITTMAIASLMISNEASSGRDRDAGRAFNVAESGINTALSVLSQQDSSGSQTVGSTLASTGFTIDGGSGTYSATKSGALEWTVNATGTSPNGAVSRELQVRVSAQTVTSGTAASPVYGWGFFMASTTPDCVATNGASGNNVGNSALLTVPVYTAGSLCLSGGGSPLIAEPSTSAGGTLPLYVGGKFRTDSNSSPVGTSAKRLASATVVGGCQISFHGWKDVICSQQGVPTSGTGSGIWANSYSSTPMTLTKPTIDPAARYTDSKPGPNSACGAGSTVGPLTFDGNTTRDTSLGSKRLLMLTGSSGAGNNFDCKVYDGSGNLVGRIAWTFGTPGALVVQGTVFIDGSLTFAGNDKAVYTGSGTIYVNGTVSMSNGARVCGAAMVSSNCSGNWNPATNALMLVAVNAGNAATAFDMAGDSQFEGLAYAVGKYSAGNSAYVSGPVIADSGVLSGNTKFKVVTDPPPGSPGDGSIVTTTVWKVVPGSWRQLG